MGIVVNQPLDMSLAELFSGADMTTEKLAQPGQTIWLGGPVRTEQAFVLHRPCGVWENSLTVSDELQLTTSRDLLDALADGLDVPDCLVALGYAGWDSGQLEAEMADNAWVFAEADPDLIFNSPVEQRWAMAARLAGIDLNRMSTETGHA
jgi:putative transcriptional regulator